GEYAEAYRRGVYRKTFERLWEQDHLVFVGFGFNDPQFTFMVGEIMSDLKDTHAAPRHIAFLGLSVDDGDADPEAVREWRDSLETASHAPPLFSPARGPDPSALPVLPEGLATACGCAPPPPIPAPSAAAVTRPATPAFPAKWVHSTTDDDKFTGR